MEDQYDRLRYRRQFLLATNKISDLSNWQHREVGDVHLYAHPDLEITVKENPLQLVLLIGYIFDPFHPERTNDEIISDVHTRARGYTDFFNLIKSYTGRYAIIFRDQASFVILHDPYGVREIYYCTQPNSIICGSQPNLINSFSFPTLNISSNKDLLHFYRHDMKPVRLGRLWVGEETVYADLHRLRPNHYLDIKNLSAKRYWPNTKIQKLDLATAVNRSCSYLKGALKAVTSRHKVMMAVTSGYDSRSLLAASKDIQSQVYYFINKEPPLSDNSPDIRIPRSMFAKLGIPFHIHNVSGPVDDRFKEIFLNNTFWANDHLLPTIYNVYYNSHQDKVNLLGLGEIGRVYYGGAPSKLDGYFLARTLKYRASYYAALQCEKWLTEAKRVAQDQDIDIMKLFLWEELIGNWGVVGNSESDIALEEYDPYSSHYIGEILISFDPSQGDLFREMIKEMWPELLEFPFNPPNRLSDWIKALLIQSGLFFPLRKQWYLLEKWRYRRLWNVSRETNNCSV
jgi:hypothetical protein